jgi:hypothetical protein
MSWRFRQSFKIIPGLKLNLSKSGLSASIGGAPFTVNVGQRGLYGTASIPGTGISWRQRISTEYPSDSTGQRLPATYGGPALPPKPSTSYDSASPPLREIHSASTELLTSESLRELKDLIQTAYEELEEIRRVLSKAKEEDARANARFKSWDDGFLLKKVFKNSYTARKAEAEVASARRAELEDQLRLTRIATQIELARAQAEPFFKMRDDFTALAECAAIWDIKTEQKTDKFRQRTRADTSVSRERVKFSLGSCELIGWDQEIPHLQNAKGGDMFLYPGFILYRASRTAFSIIDCHDVKFVATAVKFEEEQNVPNDATTVGHTWTKTNKDGSPDRRFANNYEIPIVRYGQAEFKSETGLWEEFHFSNSDRLDRFSKSWNAFVASFDHRISLVAARGNFTQQLESTPAAQNSAKIVGTDVHFECNACHQPIEVNAEAVGQEFRCPGCGERLTVPEVTK